MSYAAIGKGDNASIVHSAVDDDNESQQSVLRRLSSTASLGSNKRQMAATATSLSEPLHDNDSQDPYHVFRQELVVHLDMVEGSLQEYMRVVKETDTAVNTAEVKDAKKQVKRHLKQAEATLRDVQTTVSVVASDPNRYQHVRLSERSEFCDESATRLRQVHAQLTTAKDKLWQDQRALQQRRTGTLGATNAAQQAATHEIVDSQVRTSLLMQHQDETLDELDTAVTRVGHMADTIHAELESQNELLDDLETDLDTAEQELGMVMGKLAKFLQTKDKWQLGTIICLFFVMLVMLMLVIYW